jgi:uncharacterized membrane protein YqaE (UPF0057 family)
MDVLRIIIAILLPPLGVFLQVGIGKQFWINILLTLLGYIDSVSARADCDNGFAAFSRQACAG